MPVAGIAQLVELLFCKQEVVGSSPTASTNGHRLWCFFLCVYSCHLSNIYFFSYHPRIAFFISTQSNK